MIDDIQKRETILDEVYSGIKTEISQMPDASKHPEEAVYEHKENLQSRKVMIKEIEQCINNGEMAIDETAAAKVVEQEAEVNEMVG